MSKQTITKRASDNPYFHKDFHIALNYGIEYLHEKFGEQAVRQYLAQFARTYYAPLKTAMQHEGLLAIKEHYESIYEIEGADFDMSFSGDELSIGVKASPAVMHIKRKGHAVSGLFNETVATVNKTICEDTPYEVKLTEYDDDNGAYHLLFFRRKQ